MPESFKVSRSLFMNWAKNWEVLIWLKRKKHKFPRFPSFRFCPAPKIENSEISEISFTLNNDTDCNSRFKNAKKKSTETKTKKFQYDLEQRAKFLRFPSFPFCPTPKMENSEISQISLLLQTLTVVVTQDLKKRWTETKCKRMRYALIRKKLKLLRFPSFLFCPITKIENSEI